MVALPAASIDPGLRATRIAALRDSNSGQDQHLWKRTPCAVVTAEGLMPNSSASA